jgi:hypothetical protein
MSDLCVVVVALGIARWLGIAPLGIVRHGGSEKKLKLYAYIYVFAEKQKRRSAEAVSACQVASVSLCLRFKTRDLLARQSRLTFNL